MLTRTSHSDLPSPNAHAFYHTDANGNVVALVDASGTLQAESLYDPYGNLLGKKGPLADANRCRFSSKEVHEPSGLYYYGYRFYDPNLQRWINSNPLGVFGGPDLATQPGSASRSHRLLNEMQQGFETALPLPRHRAKVPP